MEPTGVVLDCVAAALGRVQEVPRISVALSGGMDSAVLVEALRRVADQRGLPPPRALHVDHSLQSEAGAWRRHCERFCAERGLSLETLKVCARPVPGSSPEAAARDARYAALEARMQPGEVLCVAHHANDQAETVLLHLLRGSGPAGVGAMRRLRPLGPGWLLRPLLELPRATLAACATRWALTWVSDPSNSDRSHPRNQVRHAVLPALEQINPAAVDAIVRSAQLASETAQAMEEIAAHDLGQCGDASGALHRAHLQALPVARRRNLLRAWLRRAGVTVPSRRLLVEVDRQIVQASKDRAPCFELEGAVLRVSAECVEMTRPMPEPDRRLRCWRPGEILELPAGRLWAEPVDDGGLRSGVFEVRIRCGGERCRPLGRGHSQSLKRLLQEYRVPAWRRVHLPLLFRDGELAGVAGLFVCHGHQAAPGETGWQVRWEENAAVGGGNCGP